MLCLAARTRKTITYHISLQSLHFDLSSAVAGGQSCCAFDSCIRGLLNPQILMDLALTLALMCSEKGLLKVFGVSLCIKQWLCLSVSVKSSLMALSSRDCWPTENQRHNLLSVGNQLRQPYRSKQTAATRAANCCPAWSQSVTCRQRIASRCMSVVIKRINKQVSMLMTRKVPARGSLANNTRRIHSSVNRLLP